MNLKPCSFCGHHATVEESDFDGSPVTGCTNDLCPLGDERFSMTIEQWNTRAALEEKPLSRKWRREEEAVRGSNENSDVVYAIAESKDYYDGVADTLRKCAADLDSHESESRELLREAMNYLFEHGRTPSVDLAKRIRKHLEGDSDEA